MTQTVQLDDNKARERKIYRVTILGSIGNLLLLLFKFVAGILAHSTAMLADAVHSLSDFVTDVIVVVFVRISSRKHDERYQYGYGKYETLATAVIGILLLLVGLGIMIDGATKIWHVVQGETLEAPGMLALIAAVVSIAVKEGLYQVTMHVSRQLNSAVVAANAWHHRSDALSSIGTTAGIAGAIFLGKKWTVLDPIAAVVVSVFIVIVAIRLVVPAIDELLEKSLPAPEVDKIKEALAEFPEVVDPHNLRTRRIGSYSSVDVHVRMPADMTVAVSHDITRRIERRIRQSLGPNTIVNLHVEPAPASSTSPQQS